MAVIESERLFERLEGEFVADAGSQARGAGTYWILAIASLGAAVVHFAYSSAHFSEYWAYGAFFVGVAWLQLLWAYAIVQRPSRALLVLGALGNLAVIGVWVLSRTAGVLVGPGSSTAETVGFPDVLSSALEGVVVLGAVALLVAPRLRAAGARRSPWAAVIAGVALVGVAAGGAVAMTPKYAAEHAAHGGGAGHVHGANAAAGSHAALTDLNGHVIHGVKGQDVAQELQPDKLLDPQTRAALQLQLIAARNAAMQYPTVADAERAGYHLVGGGYGPGAGAHYIRFSGGAFGHFDPSKPPTLIYDGTSPTAQVIGLMYLGMGEGGRTPEGFAGPNDHWHRHSGVCLKGVDVIFPVDASVTQAQCTAKGGSYMNVTTWMVHAWVVPGWESPAGVFSHENPDLPCADGTFHTDSIGRCKGPGDV